MNGVVVDESTLLAQPGRAPRGVLEGPVISGEWWLDPALARVPQPAPKDDGWLKRLGKRKESKAAAGTSPTAVFRAEKGNIDARMNVVVSSEHDSVAGTHANVVVENKRGHVRVEVVRILSAENQGHSAHAQRLTTSLPFARPRWMRSAASTSMSRPEAAMSFCCCECRAAVTPFSGDLTLATCFPPAARPIFKAASSVPRRRANPSRSFPH